MDDVKKDKKKGDDKVECFSTLISEKAKKAAEKKKKGKQGISPSEWIESNINNTKLYGIVTHVGKYTAPDAKVALWDSSDSSDMGYLTTANIGARQDIVAGKGAAFTGLSSVLVRYLSETKTVLQNFQEDTPLIRKEVAMLGYEYEKLRKAILEIKKLESPKASDTTLKQVFFPIGDGNYHLLTVLPSTTMLTALQEKIFACRKKEWESSNKKESNYGESYILIPYPTKVYFGGKKPQNISAFNTGIGFYMLSSEPPHLSNRRLRLPRRSFFKESIPWRWQKEIFQSLHRWIQTKTERSEAKREIESIGQEMAGKIMLIAAPMREAPAGWSDHDGHGDLPRAQRLWLDAKYADERKEDNTWIEEVSLFFGRWVNDSYAALLKQKKEKGDSLGDVGVRHFAAILEEMLQEEVKNET